MVLVTMQILMMITMGFRWSDAFPLDATESVDTDSDGVGDNAMLSNDAEHR